MYLVTGVSGLLGLAVAKQLTGQGIPVAGVSSRTRVRMDGLQYFQCDLRDLLAVRELVEKLRPSQIVHCAAATNVDWCEENQNATLELNATVCENIALAANRVGSRVVMISTDSVFAGTKGNYLESDETGPLNVYARGKLEGEKLVAARAEHGLILRTNIFGWNGQRKSSLAEWIVQELGQGKPITGFSDAIFTPLLTSDLSILIVRAAEQGLHGLYHVGASQACSKLDFALKLADIYGFEKSLVVPGKLGERQRAARRPLNTSLCSSRLEKALGQRLPTVDEGLGRFYAEDRKNWASTLREHILSS